MYHIGLYCSAVYKLQPGHSYPMCMCVGVHVHTAVCLLYTHMHLGKGVWLYVEVRGQLLSVGCFCCGFWELNSHSQACTANIPTL